MKKENFEISKIEDLSDTMFKIIEDVSQTEEIVENLQNEVKTLKESIENNTASMQNLKQSQDEILSKIGNDDLSQVAIKVAKLEANINKVLGSGMLEELSNKIDNKAMLKKQATKWQMITVGILVFLGIESVCFFMFFNNGGSGTLAAFAIAVLPFVIAMIFIHNNVKTLIAQEKAIPSYRRATPRATATHSISSNIKDSEEIKSTFS